MNDLPVVAEWLMEAGCNYIYAMVDEGEYPSGPDWMWAADFARMEKAGPWERGYGRIVATCGECAHEMRLVVRVGQIFDLECENCGDTCTIHAYGLWDEEPNDGVWL